MVSKLPHTSESSVPEYLRRLGLPRDCSVQQVEAAYHRLAIAADPNQGGSNQEFQQLQLDRENALQYALQYVRQRVTPASHQQLLKLIPDQSPPPRFVRHLPSALVATTLICSALCIGPSGLFLFVLSLLLGWLAFVCLFSISLVNLRAGVATALYAGAIIVFVMAYAIASSAYGVSDVVAFSSGKTNAAIVMAPFLFATLCIFGGAGWAASMSQRRL